MSVAKNHSNIPYYIKCALGLFFMFGAGRLIAPPLGLPAVGWQVLCIFFGLIWLWSIAEIIWPSILGVVALGMSDYCTMDDAILNALGQSTVWQMIMCMMLIGAINESGCGTTIANRLLTLIFTQGKPMLFVWTLLVGFMSISVFIGFLAGALLSWGIIYNIAEQAGYKKGDKFLTLFVIADFLATNVGTTVLPFRGVKLALLKAFSNITGNEVDYLTYILFTYGSGLLLITSFVFLMRYVFRADFSKLKDVDTAKVAAGSRNFTTEGKIYMSAFGVILVYILICNFISLPGALWAWFISVGSASIFALVVGLLSMVKYKGNSLHKRE